MHNHHFTAMKNCTTLNSAQVWVLLAVM